MSLITIKNKVAKTIALAQREYGVYKTQLFGLAILSLLSGLLEGIGINAIIPIFSFINAGKSSPTDTISQVIFFTCSILLKLFSFLLSFYF